MTDERGGSCHWAGCENEADYTITDMTVTYRGLTVHVGDVDLCAAHYRRSKKLGRVTLDPERLIFAQEQMQ